MGIALLPQHVVERDMASGKLVQLLPDCEILDSKTTLSVVYPERQYMAAKTRAFVEFVCAHYGQAGDSGYDAEQACHASQRDIGCGTSERQHPADAMVTRDNASGSISSTKSPHATAQPASRPAAPWPFATGEWRVS